ncbi:MAG: MBL fold metallo-hydrolase [Puniceicoccales bacterium]|nr:MBL fold metallo-hydrolase [Puniceicoccales bacterium]
MNIYQQGNIAVDTYSLGDLRTNIAIVAHGEEAIVIDAPLGTAKMIFDEIDGRKLRLRYLLITHNHWDHSGDASFFAERNIPIFAQERDCYLIAHPEDYDIFMEPDLHIKPCTVDYPLGDGENLSLCGLDIQTRWIPGHTSGGAAYYFRDLAICFVGDTLFAKTVGRSDLPGGDKHALFESIREKLYSLPDETVVVPGHGYLTTIGAEKYGNPYVRPKK